MRVLRLSLVYYSLAISCYSCFALKSDALAAIPNYRAIDVSAMQPILKVLVKQRLPSSLSATELKRHFSFSNNVSNAGVLLLFINVACTNLKLTCTLVLTY